MVKDFSTLYLVHENHYNVNTCYYRMSPFVIIPLLAEADRKREVKETILRLVL